MLNTVLWGVQILLALVFVLAGSVKLFLPKVKVEQRMHWAKTWPPWRIKLLGAAELAGAAGLILPSTTGLLPLLTPLAAACLAVLMAGAVRSHQQLKEGSAPALITLLLCVGVAVGRFF